ncbi:MAG: sigma-70 family RNA polymerase sigma factor [Chloroflexi bacterium]|nr:sigma-70 family RNA polymerase sigma factor [Chloroflexota bacterium]
MAPHATDPAEYRWIAGAKAGNHQDFSRLIQAYQTPVYNLCYRMLGQREDAEDATQETFLRAFTHLHQYDANRRFLNWILTIASHHCIDRLRKKQIPSVPWEQNPGAESVSSPARSPEKTVIARQQADEIQQWMQQLPPDYRIALTLLYWYDFSYEEIAQVLQCSVPAIKSRLHRARKKLATLVPPQPTIHRTFPRPTPSR